MHTGIQRVQHTGGRHLAWATEQIAWVEAHLGETIKMDRDENNEDCTVTVISKNVTYGYLGVMETKNYKRGGISQISKRFAKARRY